ncbi:MAG: hypothetical protein AAF685_16660 [Cyanobacteria bacterium P01_C01_bin.89]
MATLDELTQGLQELAAQHTALGTRLALAAGELQNLGTPPTVGLVEEVANYRELFETLRNRAIALAKAKNINESAIPLNLVSVRELEAFVESLSQPSSQLLQTDPIQTQPLMGNDMILGATPPADWVSVVGLEVLVHIEGIGDRKFSDNEMAGTQGEARRLEGLQLSFNPRMAGLGIRYMGHVENVGDTPWVGEGQYIGTRGKGLRLEGFAAQLTGPESTKFDICYSGHFAGYGDSQVMTNGVLCGARGQGLTLEALKIWIKPKNA